MRWLLLPALLLCGASCSKAPAPVKVDERVEAKDANPEPPPPQRPKIEPLTEDEERLIAADPRDLSEDDRIKRAYALRKKVMQNPDSPTARMLTDLQNAHENGELEGVPGGKKKGMTFSLRGTEPTKKSGPPPAGYRPPAESKAQETKSSP